MSDLDNEYKMLKVFSQLYVGLKKEREGAPLLGFATPFETNKAFEKRKNTVDQWAFPGHDRVKKEDGSFEYVQRQSIPARIIDNVAVEGFRISEEVRRTYWGGGNVVWRIMDPRGYELEISSSNLCRIIDSVGIQPGGIIPARCLWGRMGSNNILVPEGSSLWTKTIKDSEKMNTPSKSVRRGDFKPGDIVVSRAGDKRIYVGQFDVVCKLETFKYALNRYRETKADVNIELKVINDMFVLADIKYGEPSNILLYKTLKVAEVQGEYRGEKDLVEYVNKSSTRIDFAASGDQYRGLTPLQVTEFGAANDVSIHVIPVVNPTFDEVYSHIVNSDVGPISLWLYRDPQGNLKQLNSSFIRLREKNSTKIMFEGVDDIMDAMVSRPVLSASLSSLRVGFNSEHERCFSRWGYGVGGEEMAEILYRVKDVITPRISQVVFYLNGKIIPITDQ